MKTKYYFILYQVTKYGWKPNPNYGTIMNSENLLSKYISTGSHIMTCQEITDIHPIQFQLDCNEKYNKQRETSGGYLTREEYLVLSWQSLTKAEYLKYKGHVG